MVYDSPRSREQANAPRMPTVPFESIPNSRSGLKVTSVESGGGAGMSRPATAAAFGCARGAVVSWSSAQAANVNVTNAVARTASGARPRRESKDA